MVESKDFKRLLFDLVKLVKLNMEKQFAKAKIRVTPLQYAILMLLKNGTLTLNELAEKLGVRPPSLVPPLDSLEKMGYVRREGDKKDRRRIHLVLLAKSAKLLEKINRDRPADALHSAFSKLSKPKQKQLIQILSELKHKL